MNRITEAEYRDAVKILVGWALGDTSAGKASAQVLLSAYNGSEWQLDITDLCLLDFDNFSAALNVIRGRVELMIEPHDLIDDGSEVFGEIWKKWSRYHIRNRWKRSCFFCNGRGHSYRDGDDDSRVRIPCLHCGGEGLVAD